MNTLKNRGIILLLFGLVYSVGIFKDAVADNVTPAPAVTRGIYVTQPMMESTKNIVYFIKRAKEAGINTFVVDYAYKNTKYNQNIQLLKANHIRYVARIIVFPAGGVMAQIRSQDYWQQKYQLIQSAMNAGADAIQLDYIRYKPSQHASEQNAQDVLQVIKYYKQKVNAEGRPLQVDVFGETSYKSSPNIGQNVRTFAQSIDVLCPMLYPSHYDPWTYHTKHPYETVSYSITKLNAQFNGKPPFKVVPYIEVRNFRIQDNNKNRTNYLIAELQAVKNGNTNGWYAWSASNQYDLLFDVLQNNKNL